VLEDCLVIDVLEYSPWFGIGHHFTRHDSRKMKVPVEDAID
jgi:hypothetical protein